MLLVWFPGFWVSGFGFESSIWLCICCWVGRDLLVSGVLLFYRFGAGC